MYDFFSKITFIHEHMHEAGVNKKKTEKEGRKERPRR